MKVRIKSYRHTKNFKKIRRGRFQDKYFLLGQLKVEGCGFPIGTAILLSQNRGIFL